MEEFAYDFLSFLPALLLLLAAAGLPVVYKVVARRFLDHAEKRMAQWLFILLDGFLTPLSGILRVVLGVAAIRALPFSIVRDATFVQYLALANDLLVILYLGLGCWRAAPITRLLLRSAENHLDLHTNKTMGRFFENIFHALVMLFVGIGVGLIVRQGGSSGGDDALALVISHAFHCRLSWSYLFTDITVLALSLTYIPVRRIVFSLVTVTISSWLIDWIKEYRPGGKRLPDTDTPAE